MPTVTKTHIVLPVSVSLFLCVHAVLAGSCDIQFKPAVLTMAKRQSYKL